MEENNEVKNEMKQEEKNEMRQELKNTETNLEKMKKIKKKDGKKELNKEKYLKKNTTIEIEEKVNEAIDENKNEEKRDEEVKSEEDKNEENTGEKVKDEKSKTEENRDKENKNKKEKGKKIKKEKNKREEISKEEINEEDLTFKRVEVKPEIKKEHKGLKFFLTLLIIVIGAYCIFFSRNFIILNGIYNKMSELNNLENYSYEMIRKENDEEITKIIYYKKDNVERIDLKDKKQEVNTIIDLESNTVTTWYPEEKTASVHDLVKVSAKIHLPLEESINYQETRAFMGLTSLIYTGEYNSKECYVIKTLCTPGMMDCSQKTWIDKDTGLVLKREYLNYTIEYSNIELNNVRNIETPDLREYEVEKEED